MKSSKSILFVMAFILASWCAPAWAATELPYDQPTSGTIGSPTQSNEYDFPANAGDVLNFTVVATSSISGTFGPCIQLYDPQHNPVDNAGGYYSTDVEMNGYKALSTGTFTLLIKDCADAATGDYVVFLQKSNDPVGSLPLPYAKVTSGKIGSATQSNAYTFSANAKDVLNFTLVATSSSSGAFGPCILLYNSTGTPLLDSAGGYYSTDVEMNGYQIPASGTYNVFIKDCADTATGNYKVFVQKTNAPIDAVPIVYDQVQTGNIGSAAQTNAYTLIGNLGDVLNFTVTTTNSTSGTLGPCIALYNTKATQPLDSAGGYYSTDVEMNGYRITASGTYNVFIKDCADTATGNYSLSTECIGTCPMPVPAITSLSPASAPAGSPPFTLTVNGSGFASVKAKSLVYWDGYKTDRTNFVNTGQLTAPITAADVAVPGYIPVMVFTPSPGGGTSNTKYFTVTPPLQTPAPTFSPVGGTYTSPQLVMITDVAPGATIYCTMNGSTPIPTPSEKCPRTIPVAESETIKAIAIAPGQTLSNVASATYTILKLTPPPVLSPGGGTYTSVQSVTFTDAVPGATIYCTTNGLPPKPTLSEECPRTITVVVTETIKAIAVAPGYAPSLVTSATYTLIGSPSALAAPASSITTSTATLNAIVNTLGLAGSHVFEYGTSTTLNMTTAKTALGASTAAVPVSTRLTGLKTKTTYYYRVEVTTAGGTASDAVLTFKTD